MNSLGGEVISLLVSHQEREARIFTSFKQNMENISIETMKINHFTIKTANIVNRPGVAGAVL